MKKRGFTISELLIALGIVAVTAAMVAPMFSSIIPDKNKMKVVSYYNKINEINQNLLSDTNLYYTKYNINNGEKEIEASGFANTDSPLNIPSGFNSNQLSGPSKYYNLFFYALCGCKNNSPDITIDDGSNWVYDSHKFAIDLDGKNKGKNCYYGQDSCKKPDTFIFNVYENGAVTAGDALTDAYLTNMNTVNNQKADKELAKKFLNDSTKPYNN